MMLVGSRMPDLDGLQRASNRPARLKSGSIAGPRLHGTIEFQRAQPINRAIRRDWYTDRFDAKPPCAAR